MSFSETTNQLVRNALGSDDLTAAIFMARHFNIDEVYIIPCDGFNHCGTAAENFGSLSYAAFAQALEARKIETAFASLSLYGHNPVLVKSETDPCPDIASIPPPLTADQMKEMRSGCGNRASAALLPKGSFWKVLPSADTSPDKDDSNKYDYSPEVVNFLQIEEKENKLVQDCSIKTCFPTIVKRTPVVSLHIQTQ